MEPSLVSKVTEVTSNFLLSVSTLTAVVTLLPVYALVKVALVP
jgi:hypothetical protein